MEANGSDKGNEDWLNSSTARGFGRVFAKIFGDGEEEPEKPAATGAATEYPGSLRNMLRDNHEEEEEEEADAKLSAVATTVTTQHKRTGEYDDRTAAEAAAMSSLKPRSDPVVMVDTTANKRDEIGILAEALMELRETSPGSTDTAAAAIAPNAHKREPAPKRRKTTNAASNKLVPASEFVEESKKQVKSAGALIAHTLQTGPWPSPYRSLHPRDIANRPAADTTSTRAHAMHVSMVGASLEKFANDIIAQTMGQELLHTPRAARSQAHQRTFLGTLVLLREALILNAATIFGDSALLTGEETDFGTSLADLHEEKDSHGVALFSVKVLSTTVVLTALEGLDDAERLSDEFLRLVEQYEYVVVWLNE